MIASRIMVPIFVAALMVPLVFGQEHTAQANPYRPGDVVHDYAVGAVVPPPGISVNPKVLMSDGSMQEVLVSTDLDGTVTVASLGEEPTDPSRSDSHELREASGVFTTTLFSKSKGARMALISWTGRGEVLSPGNTTPPLVPAT